MITFKKLGDTCYAAYMGVILIAFIYQNFMDEKLPWNIERAHKTYLPFHIKKAKSVSMAMCAVHANNIWRQ